MRKTELDDPATTRGAWVALRGMALVCLAGTGLGLGYNALGLESSPGWGVPWIGQDRLADLTAGAAVVGTSEQPSSADPYRTENSDPLAIPAGGAGAELPEIPALGRPVQIEVAAVKQYVDAAGALVVDAREPHEYETGHIPGAINLPYDQVATDSQRLAGLDSAGRPIVVYCGGGACEMSLSLAWDLVSAGHDRIAVYMGGYPEWVERGYPVVQGTEP